MLTAVIVGMAGLITADSRGVPIDSVVSWWWVLVFFGSFVFGFLYYAQFVLPLKGPDGWWEGFLLLWRHYLTVGQTAVFPNTTPLPPPKSKTPPSPADDLMPNLPPSFFTLRAGFVKSHQVLALTKGTGFSRPAGPGFVMLYRGEEVVLPLDLRPHRRQHPIKATTRDGIPIETTLSISFRIKQSLTDHPHDNELIYPYEKDAIFHVTYANSMAGDIIKPWTEQLCPQAATVLVTEIAKLTLNELYQRNDVGLGPLDNARQEVQRELEKVVDPLGIEILSVGVGKLQVPEEVMEQRIRAWQATWEREIQVRRANGEADAVRRLKAARASAQIKIIENITQSIETMRQGDDRNLTEIITLRMISAMEEAMTNLSVQATLPRPVMADLMDVSRRMLVWMGQTGGEKP